MTPEELYAVEKALDPIAWLLNDDWPEPSDEMKPFVFALLRRALDGDDDAVATLRKLFPPRK
jgi:hypothetical protein